MNAFLIRILCVSLLLAAVQPLLQLSEAQVPPGREQARQTKIYRLKHAKAEGAAGVLSQVFADGDHPVRVAVDSASNSLVLSATDEQMKSVDALLQQLDSEELRREAEPRFEPLKIFHLKNAKADQMAHTVEQLVGQLRVAVDARTNSLIASGTEERLEMVEALLKVLDAPDPRSAESGAEDAARPRRRLLFYWLASGPGFSTDLPIPEQLQPVAEELNRLGVENLQLVCRSVAALDGDNVSFENSVNVADRAFHLQFEGRVPDEKKEQFNAAPVLNMVVNADDVGHKSTSLRTTITTPHNHFVVLGITGMGDLENAFVIQIQSVE